MLRLAKMKFCTAVVLLALVVCAFDGVQGADSKGYYMNTLSIEDCIPSKEKDPEHPTVNVTLQVIKRSKTEEEITGTITYFNDVQIDKILIEAKPENEQAASDKHRRLIEKPCDHFLFSILLRKSFKIEKNCMVKKGTYKLEPINPSLIMHGLYKDVVGAKYVTIFEWFSPKGALACIRTIGEVIPM